MAKSRIASIFFLCIMLVSVTKNAVLYSIYEYNTELFISIFCKNKDRLQLKCNGKCYLAEMQKEQDESDASKTLLQLQTEFVYYNSVEPIRIANCVIKYIEKTVPIDCYNQLYSFLYSQHLVKPPADMLVI